MDQKKARPRAGSCGYHSYASSMLRRLGDKSRLLHASQKDHDRSPPPANPNSRSFTSTDRVRRNRARPITVVINAQQNAITAAHPPARQNHPPREPITLDPM